MDRTGQVKATVVAQRHQPRSAVADATTEIGIVLYPGVQAACVHGLTDWSWLRSRYACGARLVSVCSGAFILAETGLVAGRSVSTHRICAEALAKRFPEITVDTNQRIIDDGDIMTAGGFLAWVDVGLLLVDRILGVAVRAETGRFIHSDPAASAARYFPGFAPRQTHGDTAVLKAQEWVHIRDGRDVSLASMAASAGLERRTFLRRFANATGMTPIEYCRAVRIARARELLECGNTPQKEIAESLGYEDVASFARVFRKVTGLAPGAHRKKFGVNAVSPGYFAQGRAAVTQPPQLTANPELMDREAVSA